MTASVFHVKGRKTKVSVHVVSDNGRKGGGGVLRHAELYTVYMMGCTNTRNVTKYLLGTLLLSSLRSLESLLNV